jgi:hypothetical protein
VTGLPVELRRPLPIPASPRRWSALTLGVLAVVGLVIAFSLSSTLVKRADSPGVLVAFWRMVTVSVIWNVAAKLRLAGVPVTTVRYDGVVHDFMLLNAMSETKATRAAIAQATAFLREALGTA